MKKIIFLATFLSFSSFAQQCDNFFLLTPHKVVEMSIYNKKDKLVGKNIYNVQEVNTLNAITTGVINTEFVNEKGKQMSSGVLKVDCKDGVFGMDMTIFIPEEQGKQFHSATANAEKVYMEYPADLMAGKKLEDGNIEINMDNNGLKQTLKVLIFDRIVEDKEKVTTPAGIWDAYRIAYKTKITIETMGIPVKINYEGKEWFVPGFGTVKTLSKQSRTEITSIK